MQKDKQKNEATSFEQFLQTLQNIERKPHMW